MKDFLNLVFSAVYYVFLGVLGLGFTLAVIVAVASVLRLVTKLFIPSVPEQTARFLDRASGIFFGILVAAMLLTSLYAFGKSVSEELGIIPHLR